MLLNIFRFFAAFILLLANEAAARALQLAPIASPGDIFSGHLSKRSAAESLDLVPISDPGLLTHGRSLKREQPGNACFDPSSRKSFFWGAYAGDNLYVANFTLSNPGDDEFILPVEDFAKRLKSIHCGSPTSPYMNLQFNDRASFSYAQSAWDWVNKEDINRFTLVTEPNQCYDGDNRSPYLVKNIWFDPNTLTARLHAEEKEWAEIAHTFKLHLGHEYIPPATVNVTHPHLLRRKDHVLDLTHDWNLRLFDFGQNSEETPGIHLTADAQISTAGQIISDFDIETKWFIPRDVKLSVRPQGLQALFLLKLQAEGQLGKDLDYALKPEIEIPVLALNIKGILEIGPYVTMGVHLGASALSGTASVQTGARASIDDSASINLKLRHPEDNGISGWTPHFEKLDTEISASIHGSVKAWAELGITIKAEAFGKWGYQASLDAQLPYFEANLNATYNEAGVCGTEKTAGVQLDANVGININLNAGEVNEAPKFQKDLFETSWPLFSTCVGFGGDVAQTGVVSVPSLGGPETVGAGGDAVPTVAETTAVLTDVHTPVATTDIVPEPTMPVPVVTPTAVTTIVPVVPPPEPPTTSILISSSLERTIEPVSTSLTNTSSLVPEQNDTSAVHEATLSSSPIAPESTSAQYHIATTPAQGYRHGYEEYPQPPVYAFSSSTMPRATYTTATESVQEYQGAPQPPSYVHRWTTVQSAHPVKTPCASTLLPRLKREHAALNLS